MFVYIHLHTVKILDIPVIINSYDLHVPLNTLLKYFCVFASLSPYIYMRGEGRGGRMK